MFGSFIEFAFWEPSVNHQWGESLVAMAMEKEEETKRETHTHTPKFHTARGIGFTIIASFVVWLIARFIIKVTVHPKQYSIALYALSLIFTAVLVVLAIAMFLIACFEMVMTYRILFDSRNSQTSSSSDSLV